MALILKIMPNVQVDSLRGSLFGFPKKREKFDALLTTHPGRVSLSGLWITAIDDLIKLV
jgi:hypothetical protein